MTKALKVLLPTNFSVQASHAQILLAQLAKKVSLEIHLAHVLPFPETVTISPDGQIQTCGEVDLGYVTLQRDIALQKLKEQNGNFSGFHILVGSSAEAVVKYAEQENFDLIVMGTKGTGGIVEKIVGTKTQHVVRNSVVPVLSMMCDRSDWTPQEVLLVHQFDIENLSLPAATLAIIQAFKSRVHLLEFVQDEKKEELVKKAMHDFAVKNALENVQLHVLYEKDVAQGVLHFDQMKHIDMLLIGTHGNGSMFHKSATEKLINHMYKPILTFPI